MVCEFCGEPAENDSYWVMFEGDRDETPTCELCYERLVSQLEAETSSDLDCSYCGISGSDREGEPLCSRCLGCFECCETLHDEGQHDAEGNYVCPCGSHELRYLEYDNPENNGFFCMNCGHSPCGINETDNEPCTCDLMQYAKYTWLGELPRTQFPSYIDVEAFKKQEQDRENERIRIVGSKKKLDTIRKSAETPIMPPMGFGESVNWTPHDGTPSLRRDRRRSEGDEGEVTNITNVGNEVYVTIRLSDGREQILLGSMEDVMLNDYVNHRGQTIKFDAERFEAQSKKMSLTEIKEKLLTAKDRKTFDNQYWANYDNPETYADHEIQHQRITGRLKKNGFKKSSMSLKSMIKKIRPNAWEKFHNKWMTIGKSNFAYFGYPYTIYDTMLSWEDYLYPVEIWTKDNKIILLWQFIHHDHEDASPWFEQSFTIPKMR